MLRWSLSLSWVTASVTHKRATFELGRAQFPSPYVVDRNAWQSCQRHFHHGAAYMKMAGRELPGLRLHFQATGSERSRPAQTYERGFEREI